MQRNMTKRELVSTSNIYLNSDSVNMLCYSEESGEGTGVELTNLIFDVQAKPMHLINLKLI